MGRSIKRHRSLVVMRLPDRSIVLPKLVLTCVFAPMIRSSRTMTSEGGCLATRRAILARVGSRPGMTTAGRFAQAGADDGSRVAVTSALPSHRQPGPAGSGGTGLGGDRSFGPGGGVHWPSGGGHRIGHRAAEHHLQQAGAHIRQQSVAVSPPARSLRAGPSRSARSGAGPERPTGAVRRSRA